MDRLIDLASGGVPHGCVVPWQMASHGGSSCERERSDGEGKGNEQEAKGASMGLAGSFFATLSRKLVRDPRELYPLLLRTAFPVTPSLPVGLASYILHTFQQSHWGPRDINPWGHPQTLS